MRTPNQQLAHDVLDRIFDSKNPIVSAVGTRYIKALITIDNVASEFEYVVRNPPVPAIRPK